MTTTTPRPKKKYGDLIAADTTTDTNTDPQLFLIASGPAKQVWCWHTIINRKLAELVPIFDSEENVLALLGVLQDRSIQNVSIQLSKVLELFHDKDVLFVVNPKLTDRATDRGNEITFREGSGWKVTLPDLKTLFLDDTKSD